jgi:hypothetical protein
MAHGNDRTPQRVTSGDAAEITPPWQADIGRDTFFPQGPDGAVSAVAVRAAPLFREPPSSGVEAGPVGGCPLSQARGLHAGSEVHAGSEGDELCEKLLIDCRFSVGFLGR